MPILTLYGSSVADATLTTACDMAVATGGVETSKTTTTSGSNIYAEILSLGGASSAVGAIPAPTGNGWVYRPGAGTFAAENWSAVVTLSFAGLGATSNVTIRFYRLSGGVYTSIGSILQAMATSTKQAYTFAATSMPSITFASLDLLYVDLWYHDASSTVSGDNPVVWESSTAAAGIAGDMAVTTATFTPVSSSAPSTYNALYRPTYILRALVNRIFTHRPSEPFPAWTGRPFGSTFIRPTTPVNIPHVVRRALSSILIQFTLHVGLRTVVRTLKTISTGLRTIVGTGKHTWSVGLRTVIRPLKILALGMRTRVLARYQTTIL